MRPELTALLRTLAATSVLRGGVACAPVTERPGWRLVWHDEFDGPAVDTTKWTWDTGGGGWGNAELQYYTRRPENARIQDGRLIIEARREQVGDYTYTSARLKTQGRPRGSWTFGRFEARIRVPRGQGLWPAFWMLGRNITEVGWPDCGEIDVMENIGREPAVVHGTVHGPGYSGAEGVGRAFELPAGAFADDFHVFAVEWEPGAIRWYVDDSLYQTLSPRDLPGPWVYDHPFFLILNVAVGGHWPGNPDETTVFPQTMQVDYVRVYQQTGSPPSPVEAWVTTGDRAKLLSREPSLRFAADPAGAEAAIEVDETTAYQALVGFGAALTDASAWLIQGLPPERRERLLRELFGPAPGLGLSFTRLTIGASDFSLRHYSLADAPPGEADPGLEHFSIAENRTALLPALKRALAINPRLSIMASPWSPPGWMKTSGSLIGGTLRPEAYGPFAEYFRRYLEAYALEGVPIRFLSIQNEPHFEPSDYPGMRLEPPARARVIGRFLGPLLRRAGLPAEILEWDHNWDQPESPLAVLGDSLARRYVAGVAWHCYAGDVAVQSRVREAYPEKDVYFTECSGGAWAPDFADNLTWITRTLIIGATRHWARGVLLWNLALDETHGPHTGGCGNCRGVVTIHRSTGEVTRNAEYYALAHASRFVRPGARRVASTAGPAGLESVAFRNPDDGSKVLIAVNTGPEARAFRVGWAGQSFRYALPSRSVVTFRWR
ncbi:MAG TPA: family 16 glycosylhydrolase [Gemmatimonadales bacterium]|nr:family 16 glycosylhydrolase [Gemmatimonadales bacterium]